MSGGMSDESDGPVAAANSTLNMSTGTLVSGHSTSSGENGNFDGGNFDGLANSGAAGRHEGALVREILYANRENVNFVHEVYRQVKIWLNNSLESILNLTLKISLLRTN